MPFCLSSCVLTLLLFCHGFHRVESFPLPPVLIRFTSAAPAPSSQCVMEAPGLESMLVEAARGPGGEQEFSRIDLDSSKDYFKVVTAVVLEPGSGNRLLALKRSTEVRSFQKHWHFISGGMEAEDKGDVVHRAYKEMEEEVKLTRQDVDLVAQGRPLLVMDHRHRPLLVHPVLFRMRDAGRARGLDDSVLNWENTHIRWATLQELRGEMTVPRLVETAERLLRQLSRGRWPEAVEEGMVSVVEDREHGAMELTAWAVRTLVTWAEERMKSGGAGREEEEESEQQHVVEDLKDLGYQLAMTRPAMAPVGNAVAAVVATAIREAGGGGRADTAALMEAVIKVVGRFEHKCTEANALLTEVAAKEVRARVEALSSTLRDQQRQYTIITISMSSTITGLFRRLAQEEESGGVASQIHVVVCESRPLMEGARFAALLDTMGYRVTLITDAQMAVFASKADLGVIGADAVLSRTNQREEACVMNKVGSLPLALCCHHAKVPVVAITSSLKVSYKGGSVVVEEEEEEEGGEEKEEGEVVKGCVVEEMLRLGGGGGGGVRVRNVYFEGVPLSLVDMVVTENGAVDGEERIERIAAVRRGLFERAFYS